MSRSNPPPPPEAQWGGHVLVVEMHAGTQPPLWVTLKGDATEPTLLRLLDEDSVQARAKLLAAINDARRIQHPSLHPATRLIEASGALGLESPYVEGMLLTAVIQRATVRRKPLPQRAALRIGLDVLEALSALEADGLTVAGGVRPDFVLVGADGRTRVLEPSAARIVLSRYPWREDAKCASYASPEQLERGEPGPRSDVFTVGVLLWEMLTNRRLFMGSSYPIVAKTVMQGDVRSLERVIDCRKDLAELVSEALVVEPDGRVASVDVFAEALQGMIEGDDAHEEVARYLAETQTPLLRQRRNRIALALDPESEQEIVDETTGAPPAVEETPPTPDATTEPAPVVELRRARPRKSERPARAKRSSERPARRSQRPTRSERPKRSNRPPPPAETPFPVVKRADEPVIRARDLLEAEPARRRLPVAMIGIAAVAMAVGSGIALLRHSAAERETSTQPASEPPPATPQAAPPTRAAPEPQPPEPRPPDPQPAEPAPAALAEPEPVPKPSPPAAVPKPKAREAPPPPATPKPKAASKEAPPPAGDFDPGGI